MPRRDLYTPQTSKYPADIERRQHEAAWQIVAGLSVIAALGFGLDHILTAPAPHPQPKPPPVPVVTAPVRQSDVPIILSGIGTVQALNSAVIRSQVTGQLQSIDFVEGQTGQARRPSRPD